MLLGLLCLTGTASALPDASISYVSQFGQRGNAIGQFDLTQAVTMDDQGQLIVSDLNNNRLQKCSTSGQCERFSPLVTQARRLAIDAMGQVLVLEEQANRVIICSPLGECDQSFSSIDPDVGTFVSARGMAIDSLGRVVIADHGRDRVLFCDYDGICTAFGTFNSGPDAQPGEFWQPASIVTDDNGAIYVGEVGDEVISFCTEQGTCSKRLGTEGSAVGEFKTPIGLGLTSRGDLVVVELSNNRIQLCDLEGACIAYGERGQGNGQFRAPGDIFVDSQDRIIVADTDNDRIQILQVTYNSPPPAPEFQIDPSLNGNWWNGPDRNGEGAQIEVADGGDGRLVFVATVYSYDTMGNQIFLIAVGTVHGDTVEVEVFITDGGFWGDDFDPALVKETPWGTGTFKANGCESILMGLIPNADFQAMGFTDLTYELIRLTTPVVPCPIDDPNQGR